MFKAWLTAITFALSPAFAACLTGGDEPSDSEITTVSPPTPGWSFEPEPGTTDIVGTILD